MEDSGVVFRERLVFGHDLVEEARVERQVGHGGQQPTVAQFALLHIETRRSFDEQLRVVAQFLSDTTGQLFSPFFKAFSAVLTAMGSIREITPTDHGTKPLETATAASERDGRFVGGETGIFEEDAVLQAAVAQLHEILNRLASYPAARRATLAKLIRNKRRTFGVIDCGWKIPFNSNPLTLPL